MNISRRPLILSLLSWPAATLLACGAPPPPPPPTIADITIVAGADANPDAAGRAAPVAVRVYQLASTSAFDKADFFQLYERDTETLGPDLIGRDEFVIAPGGSQQLLKELKPGAVYIGVVAAYRDVQNANWRASVAPPPNQTTPIRVTIGARDVAIGL